MGQNALYDSGYRIANAPIVAGTDDTTNTTTIDMQGYDSIEWVTNVGTITATGTLNVKIQSGALANMNDAADLLDTNQALDDTDDDRLMIHDMHRPRERYVRLVLIRATANVVINSVQARLYNAKDKPVTQDTSHVASSEFSNAPGEGTA